MMRPPALRQPNLEHVPAGWYGNRAVRVVLVAVSLLLAGCQVSTPDEPEEHAHHHIPGHYPATYVVAVRNLRHRLDELAPPRQGPAVTPARLEQFADLLQWLPGLALETDMTQQPWTRLSESVRRAEALLDQYREGLLAASSEQRQQFREGFEPELALWEELRAMATDQIFRPVDIPSQTPPNPPENASLTAP